MTFSWVFLEFHGFSSFFFIFLRFFKKNIDFLGPPLFRGVSGTLGTVSGTLGTVSGTLGTDFSPEEVPRGGPPFLALL